MHKSTLQQARVLSCCRLPAAGAAARLRSMTLQVPRCCKLCPHMQRTGLVPSLPERKNSLPKLQHPAPHISALPRAPQFSRASQRGDAGAGSLPGTARRWRRERAEPCEGAGAGSGFLTGRGFHPVCCRRTAVLDGAGHGSVGAAQPPLAAPSWDTHRRKQLPREGSASRSLPWAFWRSEV